MTAASAVTYSLILTRSGARLYGSGTYGSGTYGGWGTEDVIGAALAREPITTQRGRDQVRALAPPAAGSATFELDNRSDAFSPATLTHGAVRLTAELLSVTYNLFTGILTHPQQRLSPVLPTVAVGAIGTLSRLGVKRTLTTGLYANIRVDEALDVLLDAAGWPAADRVLDIAKTTLAYWWLDGEDAFSAAVTLLNTEGPGAALYEDGDGRLIFKNRHSRFLETVSTTPQAVYGGVSVGALPVHDPVRYDDGLKDVINVATVTVVERTPSVSASVWATTAAISVPGSTTVEITARHTSGAPMQNAITPVNGTDYNVSAGSITSVTLGRTSGASVPIRLTAGPTGATLSTLQLRAELVPIVSELTVTNTIDSSASQSEHGVQTYNLAVRTDLSVEDARNFADAVVAWYQGGRPTLTFRTIGNLSDAAMLSLLEREVGHRLTIDLPTAGAGVSGDYWVEHITHEVTHGGLVHTAAFGCEALPLAGAATAVWDVAQWDVSTWGW